MSFYVVVNASGKVFCGISSLSGRAMWFDMSGDMTHASDCDALRSKRDARWLAKALKSDSSAQWKDITQEDI